MKIMTREVDTVVRDVELTYEEKYVIDEKGEELYNREIEIENDIKLYDKYKESVGLLMSTEVQEIRSRYGLNQKDYALVLNLGEITINRIERGSIQSKSVNNMIKMTENIDAMEDTLMSNKGNISETSFTIAQTKINELKEIYRHQVLKFDDSVSQLQHVDPLSALEVAEVLIITYNANVDTSESLYGVHDGYLTQLQLQKLLYYVQGITATIFGNKAFRDDICAWSYGPVVSDVYKEYKVYGSNPISSSSLKHPNVSDGLQKVIDLVVSSYGNFTASYLIRLSHEEEPWKSTEINDVISFDKIEKYFNKIYKSK